MLEIYIILIFSLKRDFKFNKEFIKIKIIREVYRFYWEERKNFIFLFYI